MGKYFAENESIYAKQADDIGKIIRTIANRYIGANPPHPLTYRAYCRDGIGRAPDYRYRFDLAALFPGAVPETMVYAWAKLWGAQEGPLNLAVSGYGPVTLYWNGQLVFKSNIINERFGDQRSAVTVPLKQGWNDIVVKFIKTPAGCGGLVGTASPKNFPLCFLMPSPERDGQEGWLFTPPLVAELNELPRHGTSEAATGLQWYPEREWPAAQLAVGQLQRLYGLPRGCTGIGWTKAFFPHGGLGRYSLKGFNQGPIRIYLAGQPIYASAASSRFDLPIQAPFGKQDLLVLCDCREPDSDWGFEIQLRDGAATVPLQAPYPVYGAQDPWLYCGPFAESALPDPVELQTMDRLFAGADGSCYWRLDRPGVWVRPYLENQNFGRWNYPLGVTLYGLLQTGRLLGCEALVEYVRQHVTACTTLFQYAFWDKEQYGAAGVLNQLTTIDSLDDCGSFGSLLLEAARTEAIPDFRAVADFVAGYIETRQARLPDGAFYRKKAFHAFMEDTLWADDLYMSVPFLCRYYWLTGAARYLDDAVRQLLLFHRYLYLPERKIMSHVYDVKIGRATGVPWGRGNGWVLFSCAELLAFLPAEHPDRPRLLQIFNELCEGYQTLQDETGMWHQVLTDEDSYSETSGTAMFIYAFARGVRYGWLEEKDPYLLAAFKGWEGLSRQAIDDRGNIYGVCRGSGFSFSADYYKNDLSWNFNDTHGVGIVMLAGVELLHTVQAVSHREQARLTPKGD